MSTQVFAPPQLVLFDLDGTLVDSAPDMYAALLALCAEHGGKAADFSAVRELVSRGAMAVLRSSFPGRDDAALRELVPRYLAIYAERLAAESGLFEGIGELLDRLEARAIAWGIVTNKPGFLAEPLLVQLGLRPRLASLVAGDTLPQRKPDPAPLLHACREAGIAPADTIYVGDDLRDVEAARNAGMRVIAVAWGYLNGSDPCDWQADAVANDVADLARQLGVS
ncbi:MAG TPA: phosphoglycolate phosphatase [Rhodanobacteraceae bacterium]|nr:phosphoglycolate phosphatase [Rhodanobacteraceae bacterium]